MNRKAINEFLPDDFKYWVRKSIVLIGTIGKFMDDNELIALLEKDEIPEKEAVEIVTFIPIAFCRKLFPQVNWLPEYVEYLSDKNQVRRFFQENQRYLIINQETERYWANSPDEAMVMNIAGRSAEFKAVNTLLSRGSQLTNIEIGPCIILRKL